METALEKYFAQRVKRLFNHLNDFELNGDEVSMHDFRVELKKIRAIIKFLRTIYPKQQLKKAANLVRDIFHEAGTIRELQLMHQWLEKNEMTAIEDNYYRKEKIDFLIEQFRKNAEAYKDDIKEALEHMGPFVHSTNQILAEQYYINLNAQVEKQYRKNLPRSEWHELRKLIKQRIYAYNWIEHNDQEDSMFAIYNKLQETIGLWHDIEIIKEDMLGKAVYLSQDLAIQMENNIASEKIESALKAREKQIEEMLCK